MPETVEGSDCADTQALNNGRLPVEILRKIVESYIFFRYIGVSEWAVGRHHVYQWPGTRQGRFKGQRQEWGIMPLLISSKTLYALTLPLLYKRVVPFNGKILEQFVTDSAVSSCGHVQEGVMWAGSHDSIDIGEVVRARETQLLLCPLVDQNWHIRLNQTPFKDFHNKLQQWRDDLRPRIDTIVFHEDTPPKYLTHMLSL